MPISHAMAAGMGGIRTAGDLVLRMQMTRKMRIAEAKRYVADKLKITPEDLGDECFMPSRNLRVPRSCISPVITTRVTVSAAV